MFEKTIRKELSEQHWLDFLKCDNPYQRKRRLFDKCQRGIRDLTLVARVVPYREQDEIFSIDLLESLIGMILNIHRIQAFDPVTPEFDQRRAKLAEMMIEKSIRYLKFQLKSFLTETPSLSGPILSHLDETMRICNDIAKKVELEEQGVVASSEGLVYLFNWNSISADNYRFGKFVRERFSRGIASCLDILQVMKDETGKTVHYHLKSSIPEFEDTYSGQITINETGTGQAISTSNDIPIEKGAGRVRVKLIVKERGGNKYIFRKK